MFRVGLSGEFRDAGGRVRYPGLSFALLEDDPDVEIVDKPDRSFDRPGDLADVDAMLTLWNPVEPGALREGMRTALVARSAVGYEDMAIGRMTGCGIGYANAPGAFARPVAYALLSLMTAVTSRLLERNRLIGAGEEGWRTSRTMAGMDLRGRTLGLLGLGRIHRAFLDLTSGLGMRRIAWNRTDRPTLMAAQRCEQVSLDRLFRESDILSVCLPVADDTRRIVSAERLGLMKRGAIVLNAGRGALIDEAALVAALREERLSGAGLDVLETEPAEPGNPLLAMPNVVLTPHSLCVTGRIFHDAFTEALGAILAVKEGRVPENLVNPEVVRMPSWRAKLEGLSGARAS